MRKLFYLFAFVLFAFCGRRATDKGGRIITVSIAPYKYFVESIAGNDFTVNVMVPASANPHIYEPYPRQVLMLRKSVAYISNGYLGFEMTWLDRFFETNSTMKKLSLGDHIEPLGSHHHNEGGHVEGADPHYWVSPKCAMIMAASVKDFLCQMEPDKKEKYESNFIKLAAGIKELDEKASRLFADYTGKAFMIYHPNLGYLARDYGLEEISVEYERNHPPPSRMKELIDRARAENIKTIFVQKEYDTKNARAIAGEIGAGVEIIDPLAADWLASTSGIIDKLHESLAQSSEQP